MTIHVWLLILFFLSSAEALRRHAGRDVEQSVSEDCQVRYFTQRLDHLNYQPLSDQTFQQKFLIVDKYWGGTTSPIFVYLEGEQPLVDFICDAIGIMYETVHIFKPLLLYIEHRYYGESMPFKSRDEAYSNSSTLGFLNSAQALGDVAEIILSVKANFSAHDSPAIVIGGSYAGMLAAWMRLKYPHVVLGALASSAPILYFDALTPQDGYDQVVSRDFKEISEECYRRIKQSWTMIDTVAMEPNGLEVLTQKFHTCSKLNSSQELKEALESQYDGAAQYGAFSIKDFCKIVDGAPRNLTLLDQIYSGLVEVHAFGIECLPIGEYYANRDTVDGWGWQSCTEMVMPMGRGNDTIFFPNPFNWTNFEESCKRIYGVLPRPHSATTYYGGQDIKRVLRRFGSNIIFSNGLKDPYSSGGVLEDISDTVVAITAKEGHHCFDLVSLGDGAKSMATVKVRMKEVKIIQKWLNMYYKDLLI